MPRWRGPKEALGRVRAAAVLWALHRVLGFVADHVVILLRVSPRDDEFATVSCESGDPAVCEAMAQEYIDEAEEVEIEGGEDEWDEGDDTE